MNGNKAVEGFSYGDGTTATGDDDDEVDDDDEKSFWACVWITYGFARATRDVLSPGARGIDER